MSRDSEQAIPHVLQQDSTALGVLLVKVKQLQEIKQILNKYLDSKLAGHCEVANWENGCLTIISDNAIWATQLRFQIPNLIVKLGEHAELSSIKQIVCKIRPKEEKKNFVTQKMARLTLQTANFILEAAKEIRYEKLRGIMQRIAKKI